MGPYQSHSERREYGKKRWWAWRTKEARVAMCEGCQVWKIIEPNAPNNRDREREKPLPGKRKKTQLGYSRYIARELNVKFTVWNGRDEQAIARQYARDRPSRNRRGVRGTDKDHLETLIRRRGK